MNSSDIQSAGTSLPEDVLIILPVRDLVLFPGVVLPIAIQGKRALAAAQEAVRTQRPVGLLLQKDASALEHAHRKKDHTGKSLGIVHRDVSPQNVLISHEGDIKRLAELAHSVDIVGVLDAGRATQEKRREGGVSAGPKRSRKFNAAAPVHLASARTENTSACRNCRSERHSDHRRFCWH